MEADAPVVRDNPDQSRYELVLGDDVIGVADYVLRQSVASLDAEVVVIPHTEIAGHLRGRGFGAVLVDGVLDDVRARGRTVVPQCWYVAQRMRERPETQDLLAS